MDYDRGRVVLDDQDVAMKLFYTGTSEASVAVNAAGAIYSYVGGSTASPGFVLDVTTGTYNTFGEVIDKINSITGWKARLIDSLREDSSNNTLLIQSTTKVSAAGMELKKDTSVALNLGVGITRQAKDQDDQKSVNFVDQITSINTYGAGSTNTIYAYECFDHDPTKASRLLGQWAGGATATEQTLPAAAVLFNGKLFAKGGRMLIKMVGSGTCTGRLGVMGHSDHISKVESR